MSGGAEQNRLRMVYFPGLGQSNFTDNAAIDRGCDREVAFLILIRAYAKTLHDVVDHSHSYTLVWTVLSEYSIAGELETKYKAIKDFKKYVIEPAIADVNDHSDLWVKQGQRKTGRRVTHLQFQFGPKEDKKAVKRLTRAQIEAAAKPGETYEQVKDRLSRSSGG